MPAKGGGGDNAMTVVLLACSGSDAVEAKEGMVRIRHGG